MPGTLKLLLQAKESSTIHKQHTIPYRQREE
jgi:hypothetical protein